MLSRLLALKKPETNPSSQTHRLTREGETDYFDEDIERLRAYLEEKVKNDGTVPKKLESHAYAQAQIIKWIDRKVLADRTKAETKKDLKRTFYFKDEWDKGMAKVKKELFAGVSEQLPYVGLTIIPGEAGDMIYNKAKGMSRYIGPVVSSKQKAFVELIRDVGQQLEDKLKNNYLESNKKESSDDESTDIGNARTDEYFGDSYYESIYFPGSAGGAYGEGHSGGDGHSYQYSQMGIEPAHESVESVFTPLLLFVSLVLIGLVCAV